MSKKLGIPYMGSKRNLASKIIEALYQRPTNLSEHKRSYFVIKKRT